MLGLSLKSNDARNRKETNMEPIAIREHQGMLNHPEYQGKQAILFVCDRFNYGLSVVWTRSPNGEYTGLYMNNVDTYEVALIQWQYEGEIRPFDFTLLPQDTDVKGYLSITDINNLCDAIRDNGIDGYRNFQRVY